MDELTLALFLDGMMVKTSANVASLGKPASISTSVRLPSALKSGHLPTNYSRVNEDIPGAAYGAAQGAKSVPPPPVRT